MPESRHILITSMGDAPPNLSRQQSNCSEKTEAPATTTSAASGKPERPFSAQFLDQSSALSAARAIYFKTVVVGVTALGIIVFGVCAIYWGSIYNTPHHTIPGWVVDFDGGFVGQEVSKIFAGIDAGKDGIVWEVVSASRFSEGISQLESAVVEEATWVALAINAGASSNLTTALSSIDASYNSSSVLTFIGSEARNELEYRNLILPLVSTQLERASRKFALDYARNISLSSSNTSALLSIAPQIIIEPISYTIANIRPFDVPVASATTFVGLIYLLILSFFMVLISAAARQTSGLEHRLTLGSLIRVRLGTSFVGYFFVTLFYTLLSRAFQLPFDRRFGSGGFVIFWMLNWVGMSACGLALESVATLITVRFAPAFLILWIISNMSVAGYALEVLPDVFRVGYAFPFYNVERGVRTIVFNTKNNLGTNFGVLIAWVVLSCITLPFFQWFRHRTVMAALRNDIPEERA
ncbi:hypothetical protein B0H11DRAFT_2173659 [Mycena galericulata]|nr:hypothetical protein B0H11DRAFT_2173659 [Mycena galericulata]